jgi:hypothetical protein
MSGDETDHRTQDHLGSRQYAIISPEWRDQQVTKWLHTLDKLYIASRFQQDGRATKGNWPRIRLLTKRTNKNSAVVPGLPRNFYSTAFLSGLDEEAEKELEIQPAVDMQFTERIIE